MKTYKIIHTEKLIGWFYVDAENEESAIKEFHHQVENGEIDFSYMQMDDSSDVAVEAENEEEAMEEANEQFEGIHSFCGNGGVGRLNSDIVTGKQIGRAHV